VPVKEGNGDGRGDHREISRHGGFTNLVINRRASKGTDSEEAEMRKGGAS